MSKELRACLGLTQELLASWLGIPRVSLALAERGSQGLPIGTGVQEARLLLATLGQVLQPDGTTQPAPPSLPVPAPAPAPLEDRLSYCRYHISRLRLQRQAAPYEARLAALPALRAWTGPVRHPEREENWLALLEGEAEYALFYTCGAGPQRLLQARLAGLEREAELLQEMLEELKG
ncbi:hypothetical protein LRS06_17865 [Hymenobacter sp. J193]|uniref:hypothetical protein n=1 Tax=Hymenobacter sp. J193 TaxID=2898429 RepID=UPI002151676D|nr:hypothetical protein [Hymenobacter sp. J193]MCR5889605.1 hypothetical protein [Hymenobacter sp. J193]